MYPGSKSQSHQWGDWSEWGWDEKHDSYYRVRQDAEGNLDYDWAPREEATAAAHAQIPRDVTIENVTERFGNLSTHSYEQGSETLSENSKSSRSRSKPQHRAPSNVKDADPENYSFSTTAELHHSQATHGDDVDEASQYNQPRAPVDYPESQLEPQGLSRAHTEKSGTTNANYAKNRPSDYQEDRQYAHYDHEEELADAIAAAQSYTYNPYETIGESSSTTTAAAAAAYAPYDETEDEGPPTPKARESQDGYHIAAFEESLEELDPRYRVEPSNKFQPGEIFKVHWSEPQGSGNDGAPSVSGKHEIQNRFGTKFFVGFRRFIVVANDQGHCTCVPILTYGGKACKKKGVKADKHGIIYERGHKARLLEKEPKLGFQPVRVDMKEDGEKLSKESRVNYSKLVTVEHNVKVFFIGSVVYGDWEKVRDAVNQCWNRKNHQKQRHR